MRTIQMIRRQRGLSLNALAEASGTSVSYLSRIESGKRSPSVAALYRIAEALEVPLSKLLEDSGSSGRTIVIRPESVDIRHEDGMTYRPVSSANHLPDLQVLHIVLDPERDPATTHSHKGIEWIFVQRGAVEIRFDDETVALLAGESCSFAASVQHRLLPVDGAAEIILMVYEHEADSPIHVHS